MAKANNMKVIAGTRKVVRMGGSLVIALPAQFCHAHGIKQGDDLAFVANHIMKIIPMPEEREIEAYLATLLAKLEVEKQRSEAERGG